MDRIKRRADRPVKETSAEPDADEEADTDAEGEGGAGSDNDMVGMRVPWPDSVERMEPETQADPDAEPGSWPSSQPGSWPGSRPPSQLSAPIEQGKKKLVPDSLMVPFYRDIVEVVLRYVGPAAARQADAQSLVSPQQQKTQQQPPLHQPPVHFQPQPQHQQPPPHHQPTAVYVDPQQRLYPQAQPSFQQYPLQPQPYVVAVNQLPIAAASTGASAGAPVASTSQGLQQMPLNIMEPPTPTPSVSVSEMFNIMANQPDLPNLSLESNESDKAARQGNN